MALKSFTWWRTYCDVAEELTEPEQKEFYFAIVQYLMYENDIEARLRKNVRIAFKCIKPNLKTSRSRGQSGKLGNDVRWSEANRKRIANESQDKDKDKDKDKEKDKGQSATAACPKCGGPLEPTMAAEQGKRVWKCPTCEREVLL